MQEPYWLHFFMGDHERIPRAQNRDGRGPRVLENTLTQSAPRPATSTFDRRLQFPSLGQSSLHGRGRVPTRSAALLGARSGRQTRLSPRTKPGILPAQPSLQFRNQQGTTWHCCVQLLQPPAESSPIPHP